MWLFFGLPLLVFFIMGVIHASESVEKMRLHWNEYRCNPIYMPFAGHINPDVDTSENFMYCTNQIAGEIFKYALDGVHELLGTFTTSLGEFMQPLKLFRSLFSNLRGFMFTFMATSMSKAATSTSVFVHYLIKIRDMLGRFVGQGYIMSFFTYTIFSFLEGFIVLFITLLKTFVIVMLAISFVLALFQPELLAITLALASALAAAGA